MNNNNIRIKWEEFINEYKINISNEKKWNNNLEKVKTYIQKYNCKPSQTNKNNNIKFLGTWIIKQQKHYKYSKCIMKNNNIRIIWKNFLNEYNEYFLSKEEKWDNNLEKVILYIKEYNCKPSLIDKNKNIKNLGIWFYNQQKNYKYNRENMKINSIKTKWENFNKQYNYFI